MTLTLNAGTNTTRPTDLVESTRGLRFLSVSEVADLLESQPTEESLTRDSAKAVDAKS
jgi:hypothetical protein